MRTCACGCGRSLEGRRANTKYALGMCPRKPPARARSAPGGLQVSYRKAVKILGMHLYLARWSIEANPEWTREDALRAAEQVLRAALPKAQRDRLRNATEPHPKARL